MVLGENVTEVILLMSTGLKSALSSYARATKKVRAVVDAVVDELSFVELNAFTGGANELGEYKGEGVYCGFAAIDGRDVAVLAINPEVFSGGISRRSADKIAGIVKRACDADLPLVSFIDSAGARVMEGVDALEGYGAILSAYGRAYGNVPVITAVTGKCYGMLAYLSGCSDLFIAVEKAKISTAAPLVISGESGKDVSGAKTHYKTSGAVTNLVGDVSELRPLIAKALEAMCDVAGETEDDPNRVCEELGYSSSVKKVLQTAFDEGSAVELRGGIAPEVVTAFAKLDGISVAVVGVSGKLTARGAAKITDFLNTADNAGMPVVNLVACTGTVADSAEETGDLIRNVGDLIYTYDNLGVVGITLICGKTSGSGYAVFASKSACDYVIAWEKAAVSPMESKAAAYMLYGREIARAKNTAAAERKFAKVYADDNTALDAAADGCVDMVIFPSHTRQYLIASVRSVVKR